MAGDWDGDGDIDIFNKALNQAYAATGAAPRLLSSTPAQNAVAVSGSDNIVLNFSEAVTAGTGNIYIRKQSDNSIVEFFAAGSANVTGSGSGTITINPAADLAGNSTYYLSFDRNALVDVDGIIVGQVDTRINTRVPYTGSSFLSFSTTSALPVTLVNFSAKQQENGTVLIGWQTAFEQNNSHFLVERSANTQTFEAIGQINGRGTTAGGAAYTITDETPLAGTSYYRLKQVDNDGRTKTYPVARITSRATGGLHVFPNPVEGSTVNLALPATSILPVRYTLVNMAGKQVQAGTIRYHRQTLQLGSLGGGNYILSLQTGEQVKILKK